MEQEALQVQGSTSSSPCLSSNSQRARRAINQAYHVRFATLHQWQAYARGAGVPKH
jgi:hypothetical protein